MIDLQPAIRSYILNDQIIASLLPAFEGSKPIFTRRPVPENAPYPMIVISPLVSDNQLDYLQCKRSVITHDIAVYGSNDSSANYRNVETIARRIKTIFHRMPNYSLNMPVGSNLIKTNATAPIPAPIDDETKVGRVVIVNFDISY